MVCCLGFHLFIRLVDFLFCFFFLFPTDYMQIQVIPSFTRDTFESHILIQYCPEELKFKTDESTALIHGPEYPGKQFIQAIIVSAGHHCSQNFKVFLQDKLSQCCFWGYQCLCCWQWLCKFCCGSYSLVVHIFLLHSHLLYSQRRKSSLVLQESN